MLDELLEKELEGFQSAFKIHLYFKSDCVLIQDLSLLKKINSYVEKNKDMQNIIPVTISDKDKTVLYRYKCKENELSYVQEISVLEEKSSPKVMSDKNADVTSNNEAFLFDPKIPTHLLMGFLVGFIYTFTSSLFIMIIVCLVMFLLIPFGDSENFTDSDIKSTIKRSFKKSLLYFVGACVGAFVGVFLSSHFYEMVNQVANLKIMH